MPLLIRRLERADVVNSFDCGDQELNHYLQRFAWQNQQRHSVGTTYVATAAEMPKVVIGFYTLAASGIPVASFAEDEFTNGGTNQKTVPGPAQGG